MDSAELDRRAEEAAARLILPETPYSKIGRERRARLRTVIKAELIKFFKLGQKGT